MTILDDIEFLQLVRRGLMMIVKAIEGRIEKLARKNDGLDVTEELPT